MKKLFGLIRKALPFIIIFLLMMINRLYGFLAILVYIIVMAILNRGAILYLYAARQSSKTNTFDKTRKILQFAYDKGWLSYKHEISFGFLLLKRFGDTEKAKKVMKRAMNDPKLKQEELDFGESNLALVYFVERDVDKAIETIESIKPRYITTPLYGTLGFLYILKGDLIKALEVNLEAYDYNRSDAVILDNLGQNYYLIDEYAESMKIYEELMEMKPSFPEAYYNYALLLEVLGNIDEAIYQVDKALSCEFTYLTTIEKSEVEEKMSDLYDLREENKELQEKVEEVEDNET